MPAATTRLLPRRSRLTTTLIVLLALFLLGTLTVLSTAKAYFSIDRSAYILPEELGSWDEIRWGADNDLPIGWASRYPWLWNLIHRQKSAASPSSLAQNGALDSQVEAAALAEAAAAAAASGSGSLPPLRDNSPRPPDPNSPPEKVPRIIHQTWKHESLPPKWQAVRQECAEMHPDYDYMLWTDASSRSFIAEHYPWFLSVFDSYPYAIQRADAIRYFVLHHYGGIYMDLDIGCTRRLDPLLRFEVILPVTRPVGVSNDLIFAAKGHPFMDQVIHNLVTFNHRYLTHYPTVMFSTGPMFVSASYGLYVDAHGPATPSTSLTPSAGFEGVRVLPKSLYGKNALPADVPDAFFKHFYGSSWHAGDAGFLIFLRDHGRLLMFIGACLVAYGACKTVLPRVLFSLRRSGHRRSPSAPRTQGRRSAQHWVEVPFETSSSLRSARAPRRTISRHLAQTPETILGVHSDPEEGETSDQRRPDLHASNSSTQIKTTRPTSRPPFTDSLSVAAPKPQRISMPLFELDDTDGERSEGGSSEGSRRSAEDAQGFLSWTGLGGSHSRPQSSDSSTESVSPAWRRASGVLFLPAYVLSRMGSPGLAFGRDRDTTPDLPRHHSPAESWSSSSHLGTSTPSHSRRPSFVDRAAQLLPKGLKGLPNGRTSADNFDLELTSKGRDDRDSTPQAVYSTAAHGRLHPDSSFSMGAASAWLDEEGSSTPTNVSRTDKFLSPAMTIDMSRSTHTNFRTPPPPYDDSDENTGTGDEGPAASSTSGGRRASHREAESDKTSPRK